MERTINPKDDTGPKRVLWKKVGGGSLRFKGRIIKPGEKFKATEEEIPKAFRDTVIALENIVGTMKLPPPPENVVEPVFTVRSRGSGGWYDVVDANDKALNEKALKKDIAEKLVKDLSR